MIRWSGISLYIAVLITMMSCSGRPASESAIYPEGGVWTYADDLDLEFRIEDTTEIYDLTLAVDHSIDYPWQNLYIQIRNIFPGGDTMARPLSLELADKRGHWQGECSGTSCAALIDLQKSVYFPKEGDYKITIRQHMRQDSIPGINSLTLALYRAEEE